MDECLSIFASSDTKMRFGKILQLFWENVYDVMFTDKAVWNKHDFNEADFLHVKY